MLLVANKIGTLATFFRSFSFGGSLSGIFLWALAVAKTMAFFLAKPLQRAGISVASGIATRRSGKENMFKKFAVNQLGYFFKSSGLKVGDEIPIAYVWEEWIFCF